MSNYLRAFLGCCLCCAMVMQLVSETKAKPLVRMACALVLLLTLLDPLKEMDVNALLTLPQPEWPQADACIAEGKLAAEAATMECIAASCEAYILEKANALGSSLAEVTIALNEDLHPAAAEIRGRGDSAALEKLQEILRKDLGIPKEQQAWTWNQESSSAAS